MSTINTALQYSYDDLTIMPAVRSTVNSRRAVNPFKHSEKTNNEVLPIFTAPMSSVVDLYNLDMWYNNHITPIIPRNFDYKIRIEYLKKGYWCAFGLSELEDIYNSFDKFDNTYYILLDIANGHLSNLLQLCAKIKAKYKDSVKLMAGNIANPETLTMYDACGIDYVRVGIGGGSVCITSSNTGCHVPQGSLIHACYEYKTSAHLDIKIIADGGIRNYDDVIKALALGADYVMVGGIFGGFFESAGEIINDYKQYGSILYIDYVDGTITFGLKYSVPEISQDDNLLQYKVVDTKNISEITEYKDVPLHILSEEVKRYLIKEYTNMHKGIYGMASKKAQSELKVKAGQTAEGIEKLIPCKYTMKQWSKNMEDCLRSAMTYCNAQNLNDFIGKQTLVVNSPGEQQATNK